VTTRFEKDEELDQVGRYYQVEIATRIGIGGKRDTVALTVCHDCGALVVEDSAHDRFHDRVNSARRRR
jgi:hypothetical protein